MIKCTGLVNEQLVHAIIHILGVLKMYCEIKVSTDIINTKIDNGYIKLINKDYLVLIQ